MILILIFAEALALYGLIGAALALLFPLLLASTLREGHCCNYLHITFYCFTGSLLKLSHACGPAVGIILASKAGTATPGQ